MIQEVINTIEENSMFNKDDKVIVAVSGGPDSLCLLHLLHKLSNNLEINLIVAHVNHSLRGKESDKDEEFVYNFCKLLGIQCFSKKIDIKEISKISNISTETAGREERYKFFTELKDSLKADKIALAHNANDQAETILMRIIRGTGSEGLIGIKPVRDNVFVRPLINISRKEIEEYCAANNIIPRIDKTNFENIYTRNKIRLELIPYLQENFNKDIIGGLLRLSDIVKKDNNFIEKQVDLRYKRYCNRKDGKVIISYEAFDEDEAILTRLIRRAVCELRGKLYNFEKAHIYAIINIQKQGTSKETILPGGLYAINNYGNIIIYSKKDNTDVEKFAFPLYIGNVNKIEYLNLNITLKLFCRDIEKKFTDKPNVKYFDYDKINGPIIIRNRNNGDRFAPLGMNGSKKLKDFFIDLKIIRDERDKIPLICFGDDIAWIIGYRTSDKHKITNETKNILQIKLESDC